MHKFLRIFGFFTCLSVYGITMLDPVANSAFYTDPMTNPLYNGIGRLNSNGTGCSAFAIDATTVLTAAHCVGSNGANTISFTLPSFGSFTPNSVTVNPNFIPGNFFNGYDVAVLKFDPLPNTVNFLPVYTGYLPGQDEGDFTVITTGFGDCGNGTSASSGCSTPGLHQAVNRYDNVLGNRILLYDFQDFSNSNSCARSPLCTEYYPGGFGYQNKATFLGADASKQGVHSFGDSGGPTLINVSGTLYSVGVHSFAACLVTPQTSGPCISPDIDSSINSTFGEFAGDTRLFAMNAFIQATASVPEPSSWAMMAGAALLAGYHRRRVLKSLR